MSMLKHRTGDTQRAEDIFQDTFCVVIERLRGPGIKEPSKIAAFVHRTAVNLLIGDYRKETRRQTSPDTDLIERLQNATDDQLGELIRNEEQLAIRDAVLAISNDRDRELLYRFYILQQEKPAICESLALTPVHFDRVISRARKRFRQSVEESNPALVDIARAY